MECTEDSYYDERKENVDNSRKDSAEQFEHKLYDYNKKIDKKEFNQKQKNTQHGKLVDAP